MRRLLLVLLVWLVTGRLEAAVAIESLTESVRTDTSDPYTFSCASSVGSPEGVVVTAVHGVSSTDHVVGITYGGNALARAQTNTDTSTEPGRSDVWWDGTSIATGTSVTVSVDLASATTDDIHFVCITLTGSADINLVDADGINENVANPSVTLQYGGRASVAIAALYGGGADGTAFTPNANCTTAHDHDLGAFYAEVIYQTTPGTSDFAIGGTSATDDVAFAAAAFSDEAITAVVKDVIGSGRVPAPR